jgi:nucleotide-binding universal stress UspA family protein
MISCVFLRRDKRAAASGSRGHTSSRHERKVPYDNGTMENTPVTDRDRKIMIAVDESSASLEAVGYVARLLGGRKDLSIRLLHVLPPLPPKLREFGGSEDPQEEARLSAELRQSQDQWTEKAGQSAKAAMDLAVTLLIDHGFAAQQVRADVSPSVNDPDIVQHILETAQEWDCGTIVVGRRTLPWLQELFARHIGEELVGKAEGYAVWVVESSRP